MRKILSFLRPYRGPLSFALALMLVELIVDLWLPLLMARIINEGIVAQHLPAVMQWGGLMVGLALFGFVCGIVNSYYAAHVSQNFGHDIRKYLFKKIQSFSFANFSRFPTATLITRVTSDVNTMQNVVFMSLRIMMRAPLMMIGGLVMALLVNFRLALILAVITPVLFILLVWLMNKAFLLFRSVQDRLDRVNGVLRENLFGMRLIKAFVRDQHEVERFEEANGQLMDRTVAALRLIEFTVPLLLLLMNGSILFVLWYGGLGVQIGSTDLGEVVAIVNYTTRITGALSMVSMIMMNLSRAKASAQRIAEVLQSEVDVTDAADADPDAAISEGRVEFQRVTFRYPDTEAPVLQDVSFTVRPDETVAIMGATGSGKSSLFQLIPRLYDVSGGRVLLDGMDVRSMTMEPLRRHIGYVPQEVMLFSGTVRDNIRWGKQDAADEEVMEAAQRAQIHETIMKLPRQYDTMLGQKGINLSGGQKQRLSIARALIRKPKLLLLDDSTSALDVKTEARLLEALGANPCTTLIITQKISTALQADAVILIDDGRILDQGSHDELMRRSELYRRIVQSQFERGEGIPC
ncbi:ABC transporter ATP-binding protein/permease [Paenibacillus thiaminolyticus]|uniref:ABC transporter ATP-binding protein n=1 Tax=Paenibacillus thiaminolyticus TaxID=49283 RepID=A0AAP9DVQ4_PANTH|nr:ABC transporter ATP-binding protein [Paenibacillus thiaminolyticus]MCY9534922.1 ABC transporter ATP-binding protein/permease [Paenibacillus thiaminolyticus]MCY9604300.1 ABC transporter ATP-binding protein/permease [Paenibacillus thiaminolyticus]MCY9609602.1 ABC transporter ATP-binding protein/permease [Paenibacillus thiaminolyticus]MCY9612448.1 ABC transporter ATP-binding protein/permease [Paenibacillus thiaminolyticus]MCY9617429.1 ABC transporter ATP-binding protein/permease [Paenibacillus